jgi:hypothetical protein
LPEPKIAPATRSISAITSASSPIGNSISGSVKMPMPCTSIPTSSSQSSMCDEASRISRGPFRVRAVRRRPLERHGQHDGAGIVEPAASGTAPPKTSGAPCAYSKGRLMVRTPRSATPGAAGRRSP